MKTTRLLHLVIFGFFSAFSGLNAQTQTVSVTSYGLNAGVSTHLSAANSFYGYQSGNSISATTGNTRNSFFGYQSGKLATTGTNNTFLGYGAGTALTTASGNTFVGSSSGIANTASNNTFVGNASGGSVTTGTNNCMFGSNTGGGGNLSTAGNNSYFGTGAGIYSNSADNVCLGGFTMNYNVNTLGKNTAIGAYAGYGSSGGQNILLGYQAGYNKTGSNNIFIGNNTGESASNRLIIDNSNAANPLIWGDFANDLVKLNGKVGIGYGFGYFPTDAGGVDVSGYNLFVDGGILTEEARVNLKAGWADYVFNKDYELKPLAEIEKFINENGHLPNVPSACQVKEEGIELGHMAKVQQEKIEELTLYLIQQNKEIESLKAAVKALSEQK